MTSVRNPAFLQVLALLKDDSTHVIFGSLNFGLRSTSASLLNLRAARVWDIVASLCGAETDTGGCSAPLALNFEVMMSKLFNFLESWPNGTTELLYTRGRNLRIQLL
jgi:hypothetical protein